MAQCPRGAARLHALADGVRRTHHRQCTPQSSTTHGCQSSSGRKGSSEGKSYPSTGSKCPCAHPEWAKLPDFKVVISFLCKKTDCLGEGVQLWFFKTARPKPTLWLGPLCKKGFIQARFIWPTCSIYFRVRQISSQKQQFLRTEKEPQVNCNENTDI